MIFNPAHPGEVLKDYLGDITVAEASRRLGVTRAHLSRILNGAAKEAAQDTAVSNRRAGGQSQFSAWLDLDATCDRVHTALAYAKEHLGTLVVC
jgi:antitoxin HigA-1